MTKTKFIYDVVAMDVIFNLLNTLRSYFILE